MSGYSLQKKLAEYVRIFNEDDHEYTVTQIPNAGAEDWMLENIPRVSLPDPVIEKIYYFRWWIFRKHIRHTEDGFVITEFLPEVPWAGKHNTIIAAAGHHVAEAKWLKCAKELVSDYTKFWLEEKSKTYLYSSWIEDALYEACRLWDDFSFGTENLDLLIHYYETMVEMHKTNCGLFWSEDNHDAMEFSISGTAPDQFELKEIWNGIRPTLNSYMSANARAISRFADMAGRPEIAAQYAEKSRTIREKLLALLWDGEFFKAIHSPDITNFPSVRDLPETANARELIGYIPWCFDLVPAGYEGAFRHLKDADGFLCLYGLTTAEQRHPRFLYENPHACRWNGFVWPYATSQTLDAVTHLLEGGKQDVITNEDYCGMLHAYAESHHLITEDGKSVCWIDESRHPLRDEWYTRERLRSRGWSCNGGFERGKDYNHSAFCDHVLRGLLGIRVTDGQLTVNPHIPESWDYFAAENVHAAGRVWKILYDRDGTHFGAGAGLHVEEM